MRRALLRLGGVLCLGAGASASLAAQPAQSARPACQPVHFAPLSALDKTLDMGVFLIHYTTRGEHAVASLADKNDNGTPDVVDDLALQLKVANELYSGVIGLRPPLQQPRYKAAQHINIYVLDIKGNGQAFDEVVSERIRGKNEACGLRVYIDHKVTPSRNLTPAHELFHLYQYGYAMFKASWYLEGMARWVESFFKPSKPAGQAAAKRHISCDQVYAKSYAASAYWLQQGLAGGGSAQAVPAKLQAQRYVGGSAAITAKQFQGGGFLLRTMQALEAASAKATKAENLAPYGWPEKRQRSSDFNELICATTVAKK